MAETSHSAIGPYVVMVEEAFESNASTAFFRESLLIKVPGGCEGGKGGEGGEDGGGGGEGGEGGEGGGDTGGGGDGGEEGGWNRTTKDLVPR